MVDRSVHLHRADLGAGTFRGLDAAGEKTDGPATTSAAGPFGVLRRPTLRSDEEGVVAEPIEHAAGGHQRGLTRSDDDDVVPVDVGIGDPRPVR